MAGPPPKPNALRRDPEYQRTRQARWRAENPEAWAAQKKRSYDARSERYRKNPAFYLWRTARSRAKQNGQAFEIEPSDVVIPDFCPITGEPIDVLNSNYQNGASIDRVINHLGYVKGNVRVISRKANRLKQDATLEQIERILAYMKGEL